MIMQQFHDQRSLTMITNTWPFPQTRPKQRARPWPRWPMMTQWMRDTSIDFVWMRLIQWKWEWVVTIPRMCGSIQDAQRATPWAGWSDKFNDNATTFKFMQLKQLKRKTAANNRNYLSPYITVLFVHANWLARRRRPRFIHFSALSAFGRRGENPN